MSKVEARLREFEKQGIAALCDALRFARCATGEGFIRRICLPKNPGAAQLRILGAPWLNLFYESYAVYPEQKPMNAAALAFLNLVRKPGQIRQRADRRELGHAGCAVRQPEDRALPVPVFPP